MVPAFVHHPLRLIHNPGVREPSATHQSTHAFAKHCQEHGCASLNLCHVALLVARRTPLVAAPGEEMGGSRDAIWFLSLAAFIVVRGRKKGGQNLAQQVSECTITIPAPATKVLQSSIQHMPEDVRQNALRSRAPRPQPVLMLYIASYTALRSHAGPWQWGRETTLVWELAEKPFSALRGLITFLLVPVYLHRCFSCAV
jgi:hypothetical protein